MAQLVNLDAMIRRADFAVLPESEQSSAPKFSTLSLRDLEQDALIFPNLRKPDFQRETNHWTPEQIASLIDSFVQNELIPSVILWASPAHIFVIDGGHRLSALKAWIEDDYGDGPLSLQFFGTAISTAQKRAATAARKLVEKRVGKWAQLRSMHSHGVQHPDGMQRLLRNLSTRALDVQWVEGNAEKAESSFFKINTQGTPLDDIEELLIKNRHKGIAIAARSLIRAGMGHKYWTRFEEPVRRQIEEHARELYVLLFEPEPDSPVRTLNLPLGGSSGVRAALSLLIEFLLIANRDQKGNPKTLDQIETEDSTGEETLRVLKQAFRLASRITGNQNGSLGLHPVVYFYGPSGRHAPALFMGVATLLSERIRNNDQSFFRKFTVARKRLEEYLLDHKALIAALIQQTRSGKRNDMISAVFMHLISVLSQNGEIVADNVVKAAGLSGAKLIVTEEQERGVRFSDDTKSAVFLQKALQTALRCSVCGGYLDTTKSMSYDHRTPVREGGMGDPANLDLAHPYCNQGIKA
jgi:hypothetical protein